MMRMDRVKTRAAAIITTCIIDYQAARPARMKRRVSALIWNKRRYPGSNGAGLKKEITGSGNGKFGEVEPYRS